MIAAPRKTLRRALSTRLTVRHAGELLADQRITVTFEVQTKLLGEQPVADADARKDPSLIRWPHSHNAGRRILKQRSKPRRAERVREVRIEPGEPLVLHQFGD
jgi:hypothetical protein